MTEFVEPREPESFEASDDSETLRASPEYEPLNVCRTALVSTLLGRDIRVIRQLREDLREFGFSRDARAGLQDGDPRAAFVGLGPELNYGEDVNRLALWSRLYEQPAARHAYVLLLALVGSGLERESAAAAAALWREFRDYGLAERPSAATLAEIIGDMPQLPPPLPWPYQPAPDFGFPGELPASEVPWQADVWREIYQRTVRRFGAAPYSELYLTVLLCWVRLALAIRSPDPITRSLAQAAFLPPSAQPVVSPPAAQPIVVAVATMSTMVHGTAAWAGDWWRPGPNGFHDHILRHHRTNLYRGGARFSWSGALKERHRIVAASDLCDWADEIAPGGLQTVFAHSYGGDVVAKALNRGLDLGEMVMLSTPVTKDVERAARSGARIVDIRLRFDPVLGLARLQQRVRQRIKRQANVTEVLLRRRYLDHSATHNKAVWLSEGIAASAGL